MKVRDSGMPEEAYWESLFDIPLILDRMQIGTAAGGQAVHRDASPPAPGGRIIGGALPGDLVEFGCGYGTFTIPAAERVRGTVHALDLEPEMIAATRARAAAAGIGNIRLACRDFVADSAGLPDAAATYVMLFNILHHEHPREMLDEAFRLLAPGGIAGIIHWRYDPATPRGPAMAIRPRPEDLLAQARAAGFRPVSPSPIDLPPWHYGLLLEKRKENHS